MAKRSTKPFATGVVLGKFMPPHHGHRLVITTALELSSRLHLIVCRQTDDPIPADQRIAWLRTLYPEADVRMLDVTFPVTDAQAWADGTRAVLGKSPDAVFTSEEYGHQLAKLLDCIHVLVDQARRQVPVSASQIRDNPAQYRHYLDAVVAEYFLG